MRGACYWLQIHRLPCSIDAGVAGNILKKAVLEKYKAAFLDRGEGG